MKNGWGYARPQTEVSVRKPGKSQGGARNDKTNDKVKLKQRDGLQSNQTVVAGKDECV